MQLDIMFIPQKQDFQVYTQQHRPLQKCIAEAILNTAGARIKFFANFFSIFLKIFCVYIIRYKNQGVRRAACGLRKNSKCGRIPQAANLMPHN